MIQNGGIALPQIHQRRGSLGEVLVATQLQHGSSMGESEILVKRRRLLFPFLDCQGFRTASKMLQNRRYTITDACAIRDSPCRSRRSRTDPPNRECQLWAGSL